MLRAQPDVLVPADVDLRLEPVRMETPHPAVDAVAGDDQVAFGELRGAGDLGLEPNLDPKVDRALGEDVEHALATDAEAGPAQVDLLLALDVHQLALPAEGALADLARAFGVGVVELAEQIGPQRHPPAVGRSGGVPFEHRDLVLGTTLLHQDGEVKTGWPSANAGDSHLGPRGSSGPAQATAIGWLPRTRSSGS